MNHVRRVAVLGAGTMGSGIAAHLANLGFEVVLFDLDEAKAREGFDRAVSAKPPHFYVAERAHDVRLASMAFDLPSIQEADWVCEAIYENLEAKRALYAQIEPYLRPEAFISTNTSGLEIAMLAEGRSESFRRRFVGTHFFNPPRYLKLLELIPTPEADPAIVAGMTAFLEESVARRVVPAKDTPGFIANRFGMWSMFHATHVAEKLRLTVEQVDAITGPFLGRPRSGSFRLNDLVGLDVMHHIADNLRLRCPNDPHMPALLPPHSLGELLDRRWLGDKTGQGFYRREGKTTLSLDLQTLAYRERQEPDLPALNELGKLPLADRIKQALDRRDEVGEFLRLYLVPTLRYAEYLRAEISHSVQDFDRVMRWGFGWQMGPFETLDAIGLSERPYYVDSTMLTDNNVYISVRNEPEFRPIEAYPVAEQHENFRVRDLGEGVRAIAVTTKQGVVSVPLVQELSDWLQSATGPLVLTSESAHHSFGFDLKFLLSAIEDDRFEDIDNALDQLQRLGELLEARSTVAAIKGYCLGGGLELAMSCAHIVASAESQIGLPEAKVGLIPGGRGNALMRLNNQSSAKRLAEAAITMTEGTVSSSADHARILGYLRPTDITSYHPDRLIADARTVALSTQPTPRPAWATVEGPAVGMIDREQEQLVARGVLTDYDTVIGDKIKTLLAKTDNYAESLVRERTLFLDLCRRALTVARIRHMLENGKPLRN